MIRLTSSFFLPSIIACSFLFILSFKKYANRIEVQKNDHHNKTIVFRRAFFSCNEWSLSSLHGFVFFLFSLPRCVGIIDWRIVDLLVLNLFGYMTVRILFIEQWIWKMRFVCFLPSNNIVSLNLVRFICVDWNTTQLA